MDEVEGGRMLGSIDLLSSEYDVTNFPHHLEAPLALPELWHRSPASSSMGFDT